MTGDSGDVIASLGAWAIWRAQQVDAMLQVATDACLDTAWMLMGFTSPAPRLDLESLL